MYGKNSKDIDKTSSIKNNHERPSKERELPIQPLESKEASLRQEAGRHISPLLKDKETTSKENVKAADKTKKTEGLIVDIDSKYAIQKDGKGGGLVKHELKDFPKNSFTVNKLVSVSYFKNDGIVNKTHKKDKSNEKKPPEIQKSL